MGRWAPLTLVAFAGLACSSSTEPVAPGAGAGGQSGATTGTGSGGTVAGAGSIDAARDTIRPEGAASVERDAADVMASAMDVASTDSMPPVAGDARVADATATSDGPSAPCPAGALLCENFDQYASAADLASAWKVTATG